ncbi:golgi transport protein [Anaeramoeba flamelloides]|uniref:Golgi transport protein n=1 Tax=Anaeramoeba flamelloides TaxID=1746091 RepID=A0AAV8A2K3_9EUKA|nr:golgi transport protein 1-related [Anaeramoeba flamelloides]KAJ6246239.1 golgi transport protein [Anaeramoeba flamelloides]
MRLMKAYGISLIMLSLLFTVLGLSFFGDIPLLALGNVSFTAGVSITMGPRNLFKFCSQLKKIPFIVVYISGIVLIFMRHPFIGLVCEVLGACVLFATTFPSIAKFILSNPLIGFFYRFVLKPQVKYFAFSKIY